MILRIVFSFLWIYGMRGEAPMCGHSEPSKESGYTFGNNLREGNMDKPKVIPLLNGDNSQETDNGDVTQPSPLLRVSFGTKDLDTSLLETLVPFETKPVIQETDESPDQHTDASTLLDSFDPSELVKMTLKTIKLSESPNDFVGQNFTSQEGVQPPSPALLPKQGVNLLSPPPAQATPPTRAPPPPTRAPPPPPTRAPPPPAQPDQYSLPSLIEIPDVPPGFKVLIPKNTNNPSSPNPPVPEGQPTNNSSPESNYKDVLAAHNKLRAEVGVPPVQWDNALAEKGKKWARHMEEKNFFDHRTPGQNDPQMNNLYSGKSCIDAVAAFAAEKEYFPKDRVCRGDGKYLHYSMIIWRTTTRIGCGSGDVKNCVCYYEVPGNTVGQKVY